MEKRCLIKKKKDAKLLKFLIRPISSGLIMRIEIDCLEINLKKLDKVYISFFIFAYHIKT